MTTELIGVIQEIVKNYIKVVRLTDKATGTVLTEAPCLCRWMPAFRRFPARRFSLRTVCGNGQSW